MKAFLEEYGFSILAAIVVILLIMMISPVGVSIKESLNGIVKGFDGSVSNGLNGVSLVGSPIASNNGEYDIELDNENYIYGIYDVYPGHFSDGSRYTYFKLDKQTEDFIERIGVDPESDVPVHETKTFITYTPPEFDGNNYIVKAIWLDDALEVNNIYSYNGIYFAYQMSCLNYNPLKADSNSFIQTVNAEFCQTMPYFVQVVKINGEYYSLDKNISSEARNMLLDGAVKVANQIPKKSPVITLGGNSYSIKGAKGDNLSFNNYCKDSLECNSLETSELFLSRLEYSHTENNIDYFEYRIEVGDTVIENCELNRFTVTSVNREAKTLTASDGNVYNFSSFDLTYGDLRITCGISA